MVKNYMIASLLLGSMLAGNACALGGSLDWYYDVDHDDAYDPDYYSDGTAPFYLYDDSGYIPEAPEPIGGEPPCYYTNTCEDNPSQNNDDFDYEPWIDCTWNSGTEECTPNSSQNSDTFDDTFDDWSGFGRRLQVSSTLDDYTSWYVNDANDIVVAGAGDEALVESGSVSVVFEGLDDETSFGLGFGLSLGLSLADMFGKALGESGLLDN